MIILLILFSLTLLELVSNIVVDPHSCLDLSDHYLNSITTTIHKRSIVSSPRHIFHYSKANLEGLLSFLDGFSMDITSDNVNYMWNTMKEAIFKARDAFIPSSLSKLKRSPLWFNSEIHHLLNRIHSLRRRLRQNHSRTLSSRLTNLETFLSSLIFSASSNYEEFLVSSFQSNPKLTYRFMKRMSNSSSVPQVVSYKSQTAIDPQTKVELFNQFFHSVFSNSSSSNPDADPFHSDTFIYSYC